MSSTNKTQNYYKHPRWRSRISVLVSCLFPLGAQSWNNQIVHTWRSLLHGSQAAHDWGLFNNALWGVLQFSYTVYLVILDLKHKFGHWGEKNKKRAHLLGHRGEHWASIKKSKNKLNNWKYKDMHLQDLTYKEVNF